MPLRPPKPLPPPASANGERLALNIFDIGRIDKTMREILLLDKLDFSAHIWVDKERGDEAAVAFSCDLLTAACICDTIRSHDRSVKDYPTRVYLKKVVAWNKLPGAAVLTVVKNEKVQLNPEFFMVRYEKAAGIAPPMERVDF